MDVTPMVMLGTLVWKFVDFLKYASVGAWSQVTTQLIAWAAGVGAVFLFGATRFGDKVAFNNLTLQLMSGPEKLLLGLMVTSLLSAAYDLKKALDVHDTAAVPSLAWGLKTGGRRAPTVSGTTTEPPKVGN